MMMSKGAKIVLIVVLFALAAVIAYVIWPVGIWPRELPAPGPMPTAAGQTTGFPQRPGMPRPPTMPGPGPIQPVRRP
jgi:hypothetical protein